VPSCGVRAISRSWCAPGRCPGRRTTPASPISTNGSGPLGLLWFGGHLSASQTVLPGHHARGRSRLAAIPFRDGRDHDLSGDGTDRHSRPPKLSYAAFLEQLNARPHAEAFTDIYTGRVLSGARSRRRQARRLPPGRIAAWRSRAGIPSRAPRRAREYVKPMGAICLGRITVISSRCVPARRAFYDKRLESGIVNISGLAARVVATRSCPRACVELARVTATVRAITPCSPRCR